MRQNAVDNFLGSMDLDMPGFLHFMNLQRDALSYNWDKETVKAIKEGIKEKYTY